MHNEGAEGLDYMVNKYADWINAHPATRKTDAHEQPEAEAN
jgi:hypothetical protein